MCICIVSSTLQMGRIHRAHARCCKEADLASLGWICVAEQRCTDAALVLDASTRVAAAAGSCLIDVHLHLFALCRRPCRWVASTVLTCARCCKKADLASLGWICVAEQLYTDAAPVLDASTRVAAAAGSGLIDLHFALCRRPCKWVSGRLNVLMLGVARKLTLRASGGSVSLSSYTQTQRPC
jgi:hypothetical protein